MGEETGKAKRGEGVGGGGGETGYEEAGEVGGKGIRCRGEDGGECVVDYIFPPRCSAHSSSVPVVRVGAQHLSHGFLERGLDISDGEAREPAFACDGGILICDAGFGREECAKGIKTYEEVPAWWHV